MKNDFLERLLDAAGPSGFEVRPARVWREEAEGFADRVSVDVSGNSVAEVNPAGTPRVMLAGHIDEIGLQITHIDDKGFLFVDEIGGWDPQVVVGQRVTILAREHDVPGVVGKKPIHLIQQEERSKASKMKELWVDVGATSRSEALALGIRVGDPMVLATGMIQLAGDRIASRAIDDRIGAYVVLEALRALASDPPSAAVVAVATAQEEIGHTGGGARTSAYAIDPQVALVVDVTFSTDVPDIEKKELGEHEIGRWTRIEPWLGRAPSRVRAAGRSRGSGGDPAYHPGAAQGHSDGCRRDLPQPGWRAHWVDLDPKSLHAFAQRAREPRGRRPRGPADRGVRAAPRARIGSPRHVEVAALALTAWQAPSSVQRPRVSGAGPRPGRSRPGGSS